MIYMKCDDGVKVSSKTIKEWDYNYSYFSFYILYTHFSKMFSNIERDNKSCLTFDVQKKNREWEEITMANACSSRLARMLSMC